MMFSALINKLCRVNLSLLTITCKQLFVVLCFKHVKRTDTDQTDIQRFPSFVLSTNSNVSLLVVDARAFENRVLTSRGIFVNAFRTNNLHFHPTTVSVSLVM